MSLLRWNIRSEVICFEQKYAAYNKTNWEVSIDELTSDKNLFAALSQWERKERENHITHLFKPFQDSQ